MRQFFWSDPLRARHFDPAAASNTARSRARVPPGISRCTCTRALSHDPTHTHTRTHSAPRGTRKRENSWDIYASHCLSPISFAAAAGRGPRRQLHSCGPLRVMNHQPRIVYTLDGIPRRAEPSRGLGGALCTSAHVDARACPLAATHPPGYARLARVLEEASQEISIPASCFPERVTFVRNRNRVWWSALSTDAVACQSNSNICWNVFFLLERIALEIFRSMLWRRCIGCYTRRA